MHKNWPKLKKFLLNCLPEVAAGDGACALERRRDEPAPRGERLGKDLPCPRHEDRRILSLIWKIKSQDRYGNLASLQEKNAVLLGSHFHDASWYAVQIYRSIQQLHKEAKYLHFLFRLVKLCRQYLFICEHGI